MGKRGGGVDFFFLTQWTIRCLAVPFSSHFFPLLQLSPSQQRDESIAYEHKRLVAQNQALHKELQAMREQPSPLLQLEARRSDFLSDLQKFKELIANLTTHAAKLQARRDQCVGEKKQAEARMRTAQQENTRLQVWTRDGGGSVKSWKTKINDN